MLFSCVVAESLTRIFCLCVALRSVQDEESDDDDDEKPKKPKSSKCVLVWEGTLAKRNFKDFRTENALSEALARKFFVDRVRALLIAIALH